MLLAQTPTINPTATPAVDEFNAYTNGKVSKYDIVSYTIGTDDVYELALVSDAADTDAGVTGGTKLVTNGKNTFVNNIKDVNLTTAAAGNQTTNAADAETVFLVATLKDDGTTVKSTAAYKGFANVPTITLADTKTHYHVRLHGCQDQQQSRYRGVRPRRCRNECHRFQQQQGHHLHQGQQRPHWCSNYTGRSYTNALGHFYEYDCFVNGDTTATTIKTESPFTKDTLIYGPSYNSKGILIDSDDSATYSTVTSDNVVAGSEMAYRYGTDSVKNDVIKLGGASYAYAKNVEVYFIDVDGKLVAGTIDEIAYDEDDMVFVKTDDDGILTNVYIKVIDKAEEVTPGTPLLL
ncbi:MAG: hypothetical protein ACLSHJ_12530 [Oscillospiraceae bacterium]